MTTELIAKEPVEVPAQEAQVYDKLWIKNFRIISNEAGKAKVIANLVPYNGTDALMDARPENVAIEDVFEAMTNSDRPVELKTLLGQAMEVILQAIKAEMDYQESLNAPIVEGVVE